MDAIKKKMLAMKLEKENAADKADQLEQSVKEKEDLMQKKEEEMGDVNKRLQQIQTDCDTAQEALAEVNTKLETTEKRATDGASGNNKKWQTKHFSNTSRTTESNSHNDPREDKPKRRRPPRNQNKSKIVNAHLKKNNTSSLAQDDMNLNPRRRDTVQSTDCSNYRQARRKSYYDTNESQSQTKSKKTYSTTSIPDTVYYKSQQKPFIDKNSLDSSEYKCFINNSSHSQKQCQTNSKRQRRKHVDQRYKSNVNNSSQSSSPMASNTPSLQSPLYNNSDSSMSSSFSVMHRPDPEGACCTPSTFLTREILGEYSSITRKAIYDEFERTIFNDEKIYSDYGGDSESESENFKYSQFENVVNTNDERSPFNEAFAAVNLNSGTLIRLAIIGAEMQNIVKTSIKKVSGSKI